MAHTIALAAGGLTLAMILAAAPVIRASAPVIRASAPVIFASAPVIFASAPVIFASATARAASPEGSWLTEDGSGVIDITACPAGLCGRIIGMVGAGQPGHAPALDWKGRPMCGLDILEAAPSAPGRWEGMITDPEDGTAWHCALWVDDAGRLNLRGYVLVPLLGQTQLWTAYPGAIGPDCTLR